MEKRHLQTVKGVRRAGVRVQPKGSCELAHTAVAACSAGAEDSQDLAVAVGAFPDCNLPKGKAEICCRSKQPGALGAGGRRSLIQPPEGISL